MMTRQPRALHRCALAAATAFAGVSFCLSTAFAADSAPAVTQLGGPSSRAGAEVKIPVAHGEWLQARLFMPARADDITPSDAQAGPAALQLRGVVIAFHGCGGLYASSASTKYGVSRRMLSARHQATADKLMLAGYAVVFPDSLTSRGETELCTQRLGSRRVTQTERRADALATLAWVKSQAWGAHTMVAALGWSHGGSTVLAVTDGRNSDVKASRYAFDTAIAFYPGCAAQAQGRAYRPSAPLTILIGALDDWTPPAACQQLADKTGASITVFDGSYHGFDAPSGTVHVRNDVPNGVRPGAGVHVGPNPVAGELANRQLMEVLASAARRVVDQRRDSGLVR
jgi:dienelactone hydrolase